MDFEHERREEVIQYIYKKYGRERAGLAATVIHYRTRMAVREVGKVMGLSEDTVEKLVSTNWIWHKGRVKSEHVREAGLDPEDKRLSLVMRLAFELTGFPRHLSQHVGGFRNYARPYQSSACSQCCDGWPDNDRSGTRTISIHLVF